ncbi:MAG: hypothetical protein ABI655_15010 [Phenylobacterium sp.]
MPSFAATRAFLVSLLVRAVWGVRRYALERPAAHGVLRTLGRPAVWLMHRTSGREPPPDLDLDDLSRDGPHQLGFRYDILARLEPLDARLAAADAARRTGPADPAEVLARALAVSRSGGRALHITVSHDDYTAHLGGLQLSLRREAEAIAAQGRDHLHLHPATPYPTVRDGGPPELLGVLWNGAAVGRFAAADVAAAIAVLAKAPRRSFALHSLLGHATGEVLAILAAAGMKDGVFWLHDYASLCAGVHLMRNDVADCGAPPPGSAACTICVYGPRRARHLAAHLGVFEALSLTVAAPSRSALETWRGAAAFPHRAARILPHATLVNSRPAPAAAGGPLRVAYPGFPAAHKGWPVFEALAARFQDDPRYTFLHVGKRPVGGAAAFHEADGVMAERLAELEVDIAVVWPLCRETFGLIAHEAAAAGAAILTHADTGNVADFVRDHDHGLVLADEAHLVRIFATGEVLALGRNRRGASLHDLAFSALTADLLAETAPAA